MIAFQPHVCKDVNMNQATVSKVMAEMARRRWAKESPEHRSEIAKATVQKRWDNVDKPAVKCKACGAECKTHRAAAAHCKGKPTQSA
jgi:hypothetical protein